MNKLKTMVLLLPFLAAWPATAQSWDTSGNHLLNGTYYFRQVVWVVYDQYGDVGEAVSLYGTLNFNGAGQYTVSNVQVNDSSASGICTITPASNTCSGYPTSGTYSVSASGYGFLDSLVTTDEVYGLVSNGIFIASSTENTTCQNNANSPCYNDIFIAVPASGSITTSSFSGTYTMADLDLSLNVIGYNAGAEGDLYTRASTFQMAPNGSGNVPGYTATGYIAGNLDSAGASTQTTQAVPAANYSISNGAVVYNLAGQINLNGNAGSILIAGQKYFYLSPDGNFAVGGSPTGWDIIVGVRTSSQGNVNFNGLYYQAGVLVDDSELASQGSADLQSYYGAYNLNAGQVVGHQRIDDAFSGGFAYDYTYQDAVTSSNGQYSDSFHQYAFTDNGAIGIGYPNIFTSGAQLGFTVLVHSPSFEPSGVYIYPNAVVNAGSVAPFTAQFAPGELISMFGSNLAATTATDLSLPTTLGGTQVLVNGTPTQMSFVSPTQINAVIPIGITSTIASVQVSNGMGTSNTITNFVGETQPGIFNSLSSVPAVQHADYSMVTASDPITPGETILVYLTGLGTLSGQNATQSFSAYFEDPNNGFLQANIAFAGSQSSVGGGYQMNIEVPSNLTTGQTMFLDIEGTDSYNSEAALPVGSTSGTASLRNQSRVAHPNTRLRPWRRFQRDSGTGESRLKARGSGAR